MSDNTNTQDEHIDDAQSQEDTAAQPTMVEENIDYKDKWLRAQADYQNLQKEMNEKRSEMVAWSKRAILEEFTPVYDNMMKAFSVDIILDESADTNEVMKKWENWKTGMGFIKKQFEDVLTNNGVTMITVEPGTPFDPAQHEAVGEEESDVESGHIVRQVDMGYKMGEKVIKVAKVITAT